MLIRSRKKHEGSEKFSGHLLSCYAWRLASLLNPFILVYLVKGYLANKQVSKRFILAISTGFCGGLTTFSSLLLDSIKLLDLGLYTYFILYLALSIGGSLWIALWAGKKVAL